MAAREFDRISTFPAHLLLLLVLYVFILI